MTDKERARQILVWFDEIAETDDALIELDDPQYPEARTTIVKTPGYVRLSVDIDDDEDDFTRFQCDYDVFLNDTKVYSTHNFEAAKENAEKIHNRIINELKINAQKSLDAAMAHVNTFGAF